MRRDVPVLVGAGGTDKTFAWIARSADGWITTPRDDDVVARVARLHEIWHSAGREGAPRVVALDTRPDPDRLAQWADGGVTDVVYGLPDRDASDIDGLPRPVARQARDARAGRMTAFVPATRRRLNARQAETVQRVTDAARAELRAVGFDTLTVRSVASRAQVAPATAYTYFSSKNHLVVELFWRRINERTGHGTALPNAVDRVVAVFDDLAQFLAAEPELAAAATVALLGTDPDVKQLRRLIGVEINNRIAAALDDEGAPELLDALSLAWSGAMLQAGMGYSDYAQMGVRLAAATRLIMRNQRA